jgi:hypothetical protein
MAEPGIKIRKVVVDTPGTEDRGEYVLLHNNGPGDVDLTGWRIGDTVEHPELPYVYEFPSGFKLLNGAGVRLHTGIGIDDPQNLFWGHDVPVWTNTGDRVRLVNPAEEIVDSIEWPIRPPGGRVLRTKEIAEEIAAYAATHNGIGTATGEVQWMARPDDTELFWREHTGGTVFHSGFAQQDAPPPQIVHITAPIYTKYQALGGVKKLGLPLTGTLPATPSHPGEAVFQDFAELSIYWSSGTGARAVQGAILTRWRSPEIGGAGGSFGMPISDERTESGSDLRFTDFEHGSIWWTPQSLRAISEIRVEYTGFHCFGETAVDGFFTGSDEMYFAVDVEPLDRPRDRPQQVDDSVWVTALPPTGPVYTGVDSGGTYPDRVVVFQGRPAPLRIKALAFESDEGDANALRGEIQGAVAAVGAVGAAVFPAASAVLLNPAVQAAVTNAVNRIADTGDDFIGRATWQVDSRRKLLALLDAGVQPEPGVGLASHAGLYMTDGDASYKAYFEIIAVIH